MAHSDEKVDAARTLYKQGYTQDSISKILGLSEKTVRVWKERYGWDAYRGKWQVVEDNTLELIQYQSMALRKKQENLLEEGQKTGDYALLNKGDIDALQKLSTIFKSEVKEFASYSKVVQDLMRYLYSEDLALAKTLLHHIDGFLAEKQKAFT
jgi:Putative ATPase subunit of terminase (gpP-like)